ncbi:MAG TPA: ABC transporter ATP-binding protein [Syntrophales bacterium]|nr:ABC transporter ATP-binding protein [Syntrophobacterales bacterium]HQL90183.1 ABC transporter ATP-binding protein [Syntrophales bacterium]
MQPILQIENLSTHFETARGSVKAVDGVDLRLNEGDTLGIVGESGCGKTVLALSVIRLVPRPPGRIVSGRVLFEGEDLLALSEEQMRRIRGRRISMIFQEPMTSLNPVFRIGDQVAETLRLHEGLSARDAHDRAVEMLRLVGIPAPEQRARDYPHQMSGGMRQRVMIAMALSCRPRLMLADEPTTALDVTIQAQILELIRDLKREVGTSVILITHDLGVIAEAAQHAAVMYAGWVVEQGPVGSIFSSPLHPYTVGLMQSIPRIGTGHAGDGYLNVIPGTIPDLLELPSGCKFRDRCSRAMPVCAEKRPELIERTPGHSVRCWLHV